MRIGLNFHTTNDAKANRIIAVTDGQFHHVSIRVEPDEGEMVYFESSWTKDPANGKDGVRGPLPMTKLSAWLTKPTNRVYFQPCLPFTDEEAETAVKILSYAAGRVRYAHIQLLGNFLHHRLGIILRAGLTASRDRWTCSETAARIFPVRLWDRLGLGDITFDQIVPSSRRVGGLFEATEKLVRVKP